MKIKKGHLKEKSGKVITTFIYRNAMVAVIPG